MKLNLFSSVIIFISAYSPLALILAVKDIDSSKLWFTNPITSISILIIGLISVLILNHVVKDSNYGHRIKIEKISNKSNTLINYTIPYMISFFGFNMGETTDLIAFLLFMCLLCLLTIRTQTIFINPILAIRGYGLFDVTYMENNSVKEGIFITKYSLKINQSYLIEKVSNFTYLTTNEVKNGDRHDQ